MGDELLGRHTLVLQPAMTAPALVWKRWGHWAAHLFEGPSQLCPTPHGRWRFTGERTAPKPSLVEVEVGPGGLPYGVLCTRCLKIFHERRHYARLIEASVRKGV